MKKLMPWLMAVMLAVVLASFVKNYFVQSFKFSYRSWYLVVAVYVLVTYALRWRKGERLDGLMTATPWRPVLCVVWIGALLSYIVHSDWLAMGCLLLAVGGLMLYLAQFRKVDQQFGLWLLLLLLMRIPYEIEGRLYRLLEVVSAQLASVFIDAAEIHHVIEERFAVIAGYRVELDLICNNYYAHSSVMAMVAVYAFLRRRRAVEVLLLIVAGFGISTVVNGLRIAAVVYYYENNGLELMEGGWVWLIEAASFLLSFGILLSCDALLCFLLGNVNEGSQRKSGQWLVRIWNHVVDFNPGKWLQKYVGNKASRPLSKKLWNGVLGALSLLIVFFVGLKFQYSGNQNNEAMMVSEEELYVIDPTRVHFDRPGWKLVDTGTEKRPFDSIWGQFSFYWKLQYQGKTVIVALDYPFNQWHDVKVCYGNLGWGIKSEGIRAVEGSGDWKVSETIMSIPNGDSGYILCSHLNHKGEPVQPKPTLYGWEMVKFRLNLDRWQSLFSIKLDKQMNTFYQTQAMVETGLPLDDAEMQEIRMMYGEFREQVRQLIKEKSKQ